MLEHIVTILSAALFVIAIISGIGPQSLNIMSQAIKRNYEYTVATTCFIADGSLIFAGSIGFSLSNSSTLIIIINLIGTIFMLIYVASKIKGLFFRRLNHKFNNTILTKKQAIIKAIMLTWLNPLVFIDTIVIIGGTSMQYAGTYRIEFILGALLGDLIWIYGLTLIGRTFSHQLNKPRVWVILDSITVLVMSFTIYKTIIYLYGAL